MTIKQAIERARATISIRNVMIRNAHIKKLIYFGSPNEMPSQLLNKEIECYLYNPTRQLFIIKITT